MPKHELDTARADFLATLEVVEAGFGDAAFKRWDPEKKTWRQLVLASLYDAEMFAARDRDPELVGAHRHQIVGGLKQLFSDDDFRRSIDAATNTPRLFRYRISKVRELLDGATGAS